MTTLDLHNTAIARLKALVDDPHVYAIATRVVQLAKARDNAQSLAEQWQATCDRYRSELDQQRRAYDLLFETHQRTEAERVDTERLAELLVLKAETLIEAVRDFAAAYEEDCTSITQQERWAAVLGLIGVQE